MKILKSSNFYLPLGYILISGIDKNQQSKIPIIDDIQEKMDTQMFEYAYCLYPNKTGRHLVEIMKTDIKLESYEIEKISLKYEELEILVNHLLKTKADFIIG